MSASFLFRFMDVHAGAARDRHREQFFEVPPSQKHVLVLEVLFLSARDDSGWSGSDAAVDHTSEHARPLGRDQLLGQVASANLRLADYKRIGSYLLWNAEGVYTSGALAAAN
jgi:hypothetical protein